MKRSPLAMPFVLLIAGCASVAGCGSIAGTAATSAAPAGTHSIQLAGAHSTQLAGVHSKQLTGRQLAAALVPGSAFPHGYRYDSSTAFDSGNRLETGPVRYKLASVGCGVFANNFGRSGFGESAVAGNSYGTIVDNYTAQTSGSYDQTVYQFASVSAASSFWRGLRSLLVRCPGFGLASVLGKDASTTQRFSAVQMPGARAFRVDITAIAKILGHTMATRIQVWIAVTGQDVFDADAVGIDRKVPANPAAKTILRELISRVLAA